MDNSPFIITAEQMDYSIPASEIGGKAFNLWRILEKGVTVPPWIVVTSSAHREILRPIQSNIGCLIGALDKVDAVPHVAEEIRTILADLKLDKSFTRALESAVHQQFEDATHLAVRSSASEEDGPCHSFAGQFDSYLNVTPGQVCRRVLDIWRSAFSERVLAYRLKKNLKNQPAAIAVIIQAMVIPRASGVMFTREPQRDRREVIIEAAYGLGEGVVANQAETDSYRIGWASILPTRIIRRKSKYITVSPNGNGGTIETSVPVERMEASVLSFREIHRLKSTAISLERTFGCPQDIEWSLDGSGRLFILQTRPITKDLRASSAEPVQIWDNSNIVESYPGLTLPLTFSFIQSNYEVLFRASSCGMVMSKERLAARSDIWQNMVGLIQGRVYYNLKNWYTMLSFLPGCHRHKISWDAMIGISRDTKMIAGRLPWYDRLYAIVRMLILLAAPHRIERRFFKKFSPLYERYRAIDIRALSNHGIIAHFHQMERELFRFWHMTLYTDFCAMKYFEWLKFLCRRWTSAECTNLHSDLLGGQSGIESVKPVRSAVALAEMIRGNSIYRTLLKNNSPEDAWRQISNDTTLLPLQKKCDEHLKLYGDRCAEELKLETITPRERPEMLIKIIQDYLDTGLTVSGLIEREMSRRREAECQLNGIVKNPLKRNILRTVLACARKAVAGRENMRFARTRVYGLARAVFHLIGERMAELRVLAKPEDIGYLTVLEIFGFLSGTAVSSELSRQVELRQSEYRQFAGHTYPSRFETTGSPTLCRLPEVEESGNGSNRLVGTACSSGVAEGKAIVVQRPDDHAIEPNQIIVAESTDPSWVFLMINAKGIIVERGSVLSHTAIIGRELGIPTIVGATGATRLIPDRSLVRIDGATGEVVWK